MLIYFEMLYVNKYAISVENVVQPGAVVKISFSEKGVGENNAVDKKYT